MPELSFRDLDIGCDGRTRSKSEKFEILNAVIFYIN